jgi:hypothetical protein
MRSAKTLLLLTFAAMLLSAALPASAVEGEYFSVSGTVTDANWNPIPGALITLYDFDFNRITTQNTNSQGYFAFQGVSVKSNVFNLRVSYTDENGVSRSLPGYYIPAMTAKGDIKLDTAKTHYDDYTLPGSQPRLTATPAPTITAAPTATPQPAQPADNTVVYLLLFIGGAIAGAAVATLACFVAMRTNKP